VPDGLLDNMVEYLLGNLCPVKTAAAVLAEGTGIKHLVGQSQAQKPAIGHVHLNLAHQLALGTDAEQIADEKSFEQNLRRNRRAAIVRAIKTGS